MKLIVTGASGFVGRPLVKHLGLNGHQLLLVGRNQEKLQTIFPKHVCCSYSDLKVDQLTGFDHCIHLAALNNNSGASAEHFQSANVELLKFLCDMLVEAKVKRHIYLSSIQAGDEGSSIYAKTKQQAEQLLLTIVSQVPDWNLTILRPAFVHHMPYRGKISFLNALPLGVANFFFQAFSSLRPSVSYNRLEKEIDLALKNNGIGTSGRTLVLSDRQKHNPVYVAGRKAIDLAFASVVFPCLLFLYPVLFVLIKWDSPGVILFAQDRVGKDGKIFSCFKFRSMQTGTKAVPTHHAAPYAVTRVGRFLRRSKIDELPQVWNILRGEMSVVGPRPSLPTQNELIAFRSNLGVLEVLPGLTGYSQVSGIDMSDPVRLAQSDNDYINRRTLTLDLKIIFQTVWRV